MAPKTCVFTPSARTKILEIIIDAFLFYGYILRFFISTKAFLKENATQFTKSG